MNPRRKKRLSIALVIVIGLGSMTGLVLYALKQNIDLFYTPTQLVEGLGEDKVKPEIGQRLRIGGLVMPGTVKRNMEDLKVSFILSDDRGGLVTLEYEGILPDLFREGQGIVAQGVLKSANVIAASEVLAKHDEEYMPPEVAEAIKGIKHMKPEYGNETK
ncbi:cytochrome c maturation protein CcmE [Moritella viscosa]|uniref:Cytochrome c-type biogenesis protein CcmE n=1 Tax=Moritella viscosa TaxID=80854 RepID=A0A090IJ45_9GAMM|nr:cytochrome c maturation protein CcmE [Moritella viscosa]CED61222.1 cytochrome c-type biogenesis protein CcmE (cytochrome c maturation protein E) (heme chaperone CcmE) [Moritella viscosa]SGY88044.1 Cytochrome c-type biogenesis protein CcmE-Cytochrome c maturation protein E-Heme chaperone CcmE [Moritella viscosa]SGY91251.1 Cytochrome c-type biogenesis protein CcmE-Cytochrome c maturation protein E-Heme chaperone CcmE [Moritella viscosa]SGY91277.1 Cytochrome c-type biogenesis protein CcmE-Cytoc